MKSPSVFFLFVLILIGTTAFVNFSKASTVKQSYQLLNNSSLGISIVLYRVDKAENIGDLLNLEKQIDKKKSVNLYKITQDLGIVFMNTVDPYGNTEALPFKMLFGTFVQKQVGNRIVSGFISNSEVAAICEWIKKNSVDKYAGFSKMYDNLSKDAKQELVDIGADDKESLFNGYVKPLTQFYFAALKDKNSIVICGE